MNQDSHNYLGETLEVDAGEGIVVPATVAYRDDSDPDRLVVIFPPNPILGGDSRNNVVQALLEEVVARGGLGVAFDYRGTADGQVGDVDMMTYWEKLNAGGDFSVIADDALKVVAAVKEAFGARGCAALVGYSFGCLIALQVASRLGNPPVRGISPPLLEHDFSAWLNDVDLGVFIAPDDIFCPAEAARDMLIPYGVGVETVEGDDHFFRGTEQDLARRVLDSLEEEENG